jgi:hypothetical protein
MRSFQLKAGDTSYDKKMYFDLGLLYTNYIIYLVKGKRNVKLFTCKQGDIHKCVAETLTPEMFDAYEIMDKLVSLIF